MFSHTQFERQNKFPFNKKQTLYNHSLILGLVFIHSKMKIALAVPTSNERNYVLPKSQFISHTKEGFQMFPNREKVIKVINIGQKL